jgi:hypothetical protein
MTAFTVTDPSLDIVSAQSAVKVTGLKAGEDLEAGDFVYIKSDGKVWRTMAEVCTIATIPDRLGVVAESVSSGQAVTIFGRGARLQYSTGMTPGALLYTSGSGSSGKGKTVDSAVAAGDNGCAMALDATDILVII